MVTRFKVLFKARGYPNRSYVTGRMEPPVESSSVEMIAAVSVEDCREKALRIVRDWMRMGRYSEIKFKVFAK